VVYLYHFSILFRPVVCIEVVGLFVGYVCM